MSFFTSLGSSRMFFPDTVTSPDVADRYPVMMFIVVVLPAPLGPKKPTMVPSSTVKLTRSSARFWP